MIELGYLVGIGGVVLYTLCVKNAYMLTTKIDNLHRDIKLGKIEKEKKK